MSINIIINQMIQLFLVIFLGFILYKFELLNDNFNKNLTKLILNVTLPSMILSSVLNQTEKLNTSDVLLVFSIAIGMFIFLPIISYILVKLLHIQKDKQGLYMFMNMFSNIGFMGFPILNALYGQTAVFYGAIFNLVFTLSSFTIGIPIITLGTKNQTKFNLNCLKTPGVIISTISIAIYFLHITLPEIIGSTCTTVGNITTPAAMMLIGANLAKMNFNSIFGDFKVYPFSIVKQLILPILIYPIMHLIIKDEFILGITLLMLIMPVANNSILFATEYGADEELAAKVVFITTILSLVTIPLVIYICLN